MLEQLETVALEIMKQSFTIQKRQANFLIIQFHQE